MKQSLQENMSILRVMYLFISRLNKYINSIILTNILSVSHCPVYTLNTFIQLLVTALVFIIPTKAFRQVNIDYGKIWGYVDCNKFDCLPPEPQWLPVALDLKSEQQDQCPFEQGSPYRQLWLAYRIDDKHFDINDSLFLSWVSLRRQISRPFSERN